MRPESIKDPELLAEAKQTRMDIDPVTGEHLKLGQPNIESTPGSPHAGEEEYSATSLVSPNSQQQCAVMPAKLAIANAEPESKKYKGNLDYRLSR